MRLNGFKNVSCKLKPVVLSCDYGFRNNLVLHSVYFRSLVDLENKSCVRVPPVVRVKSLLSRLSKKPFKWFVSSFSQKAFTRHLEGFFQDPKVNPTSGTLMIYIYEWHSYTILVF